MFGEGHIIHNYFLATSPYTRIGFFNVVIRCDDLYF